MGRAQPFIHLRIVMVSTGSQRSNVTFPQYLSVASMNCRGIIFALFEKQAVLNLLSARRTLG